MRTLLTLAFAIVAVQPGAIRPTASRGPHWYSGSVNLHAVHGDAAADPKAVADTARRAGLDFITVANDTDTTHDSETLAAPLLRIPSEELITGSGHLSVLGWLNEPRVAATTDRALAAAHKSGALVSLNHPFGSCDGCAWHEPVPATLDAIEIWNGAQGPHADAVAMWDRLLGAGRHITAVGGSDSRSASAIDVASVRVLAPELTTRAILDAIRHGRVIVMRNAQTPPPALVVHCGAREAGIGDSLKCKTSDTVLLDVSLPGVLDARADLFWNGERVSSKPIGRGVAFAFPASVGYGRVHVHAADGSAMAVTNPFYIVR